MSGSLPELLAKGSRVLRLQSQKPGLFSIVLFRGDKRHKRSLRWQRSATECNREDNALRAHSTSNGRRHEVEFGDTPVRVEIYHSDETVEIFIEADFETIPEERRRFAPLNIPRHLFSEATAAAARRAANPRRSRSTN